MGKNKVTSFDVAKAAGVSRTTVSYVLNRVECGISPQTAEKVLKTARDLGYVPNAAGRALASSRTKNIGIFCPPEHLTHSHLLQIIAGLNEVTQRHNFRLLIDTYMETPEGDALLSLSRAKSIDGLVLFEIKEKDDELQTLLEEHFPVVVMGNYPDHEVCSVDVDVEKAAYEATEHLIGLGHREIGFISNAPLYFTTARDRIRGFSKAMEQAGLPVREEWMLTGNYSSDSGYETAANLTDTCRELPTALFVASDTIAFGVIRALNEKGIKVPDDISVIGFDDVPLSSFFIPALTTLSFSGYQSGVVAGEMLIELIDEKIKPGKRILLETKLIERESTIPCGSPGSLIPNK